MCDADRRETGREVWANECIGGKTAVWRQRDLAEGPRIRVHMLGVRADHLRASLSCLLSHAHSNEKNVRLERFGRAGQGGTWATHGDILGLLLVKQDLKGLEVL